MRGGIVVDQDPVVSAADDLPVFYYHAAERSAVPLADPVKRLADRFGHIGIAGFDERFLLLRIYASGEQYHQQNA